uniref:Uncharacterized protein LOC114335812 n=1 Tax=Diabrotica virgifera virgifera TaxID=50390 RepID=A0A6P7GC80_DIAVI
MKKKLTEEELLRLLETSDEEFSDFLDSDSEYLPESEDEIENTLPTALIEDTEDTPNLLVDVDESDKWKENFDGMKNFPFLKHQELLVEVSDNNPVDFFRMLLTDECLQQVCDETNRYAEHIFLSNAGATHSRIFDWKILTSEELLVFLGLVLKFYSGSSSRRDDSSTENSDPLYGIELLPEKSFLERQILVESGVNRVDLQNPKFWPRNCVDEVLKEFKTQDLNSLDFESSKTKIGKQNIYCTKSLFYKVLKNGEKFGVTS